MSFKAGELSQRLLAVTYKCHYCFSEPSALCYVVSDVLGRMLAMYCRGHFDVQ